MNVMKNTLSKLEIKVCKVEMAEYESLEKYEKDLTRIIRETESPRIKKVSDSLTYGSDKDLEKVLEDKKIMYY